MSVDVGAVSRLTDPATWAELRAPKRAELFQQTRDFLWDMRWQVEGQVDELAILDTLIVLMDEWGGEGALPPAVQSAARTALLRAPSLAATDEQSGVRRCDDFSAIPSLLDELSKAPGVFGAFVLDQSGELMAAAGDRTSLDLVAAVGASSDARKTELPRRLRLMGRRQVEVQHGKVVLLVVVDPRIDTTTLRLEDVAMESSSIFDRLLRRLDAWAEPFETLDRDDLYKD